MDANLIPRAIPTEQLITLANKYCDGYRPPKMSVAEHHQIWCTIADFLTFLDIELRSDLQDRFALAASKGKPK